MAGLLARVLFVNLPILKSGQWYEVYKRHSDASELSLQLREQLRLV